MAKADEILMAIEVNGLTGEIVEREFTKDEIAQRKLDQEEAKVYQTDIAAKEAARQSAFAKLAELGLTEEEIQAL